MNDWEEQLREWHDLRRAGADKDARKAAVAALLRARFARLARPERDRARALAHKMGCPLDADPEADL